MSTALWPGERLGLQEDLFQALAKAGGMTPRRLLFAPLRLRGFPETANRAEEALARAKRQPKGALGRVLKRAMLACQYNWSRHWFQGHPGDLAIVWNGLTGTRWIFAQGAKDAGARTLYAELAPLPGFLSVDPQGINAAGRARLPDDAPPADPDVIADLRSKITARAPRRKDIRQDTTGLKAERPFIFVPLQVPNDTQITLFAGWIGNLVKLIDLLADLSKHLPEGWEIRFKEHPSSKIPLGAELAAACARSHGRLVVDNTSDTFQQVAAAHAVLTVNSSVGLQAMLWDKPVIALGQAYWAKPDFCACPGSPADLAALLAQIADLRPKSAAAGALITWLARDYLVPLPPDPDDLRTRFFP